MSDQGSRSIGQAWPRALTLGLVLASMIAGCARGPTDGPTVSSSPSEGSTPRATLEPSASSTPEPATVRLALDWTPNTNHTGFYVAQAKGWYADRGIALEVLPYTGATPESIVASGQAECGISFHDSLTFAVAAGAKITSVMAILQHAAQEVAVLADGPITRPRDLDGKLYAGFGYPNEVPTLQAIIRSDGGTGDFKVATLNAAAYEALYGKQTDFVITFTAWEGIEAKERGIDLRYFRFTDYGFPDFYQVVLACNDDWLAREPDAARRFVAATVQGFEFAQADPDGAARILVDENPGVFEANPTLPLESARFLARNGFYVDANGLIGRQTAAQWAGYSDRLFEMGLLTDPDGKPLTERLDTGRLFTNDYLP